MTVPPWDYFIFYEMEGTDMMRLDRFLGENGFGTRQECKKMIRNGRVKVNNCIAKESDIRINEENDVITVDNVLIEYEKFHYLMLNKPKDYVCSAHELGQESILSLIHETYALDSFPIGRLDKDTVGLLILTNDGQLSHMLLAPSKHVEKEYEVQLREELREETIEAFACGIDIGDDKPTLPAQLVQGATSKEALVTLHEGRFHQIKRMFEACNNEVIGLKRIRMKNIVLDENLEPGSYRKLSEEEIRGLKGNE